MILLSREYVARFVPALEALAGSILRCLSLGIVLFALLVPFLMSLAQRVG